MRAWTQNLSYDRLATWRHGRGRLGPIQAEWSVFHRCGVGVAVRAQGFSVRLRWFALYLSVGESERSREFSVSCHDGCIWISHPWERQMEWRSRDPWWKKAIVLHVVDWLIGPMRCEVIKGETRTVFVPMPEGSYQALATHQTYVRRRRFYWPESRENAVQLDIPGGIPHSGKGENDYDCGDDGLWGCGGKTEEDAIARAVASVLKDRRRYGLDSKQTGIVPRNVITAALTASLRGTDNA